MGNSYTPNIAYNKKRVHRSKHYTIMIPDDAFLRTNVKMANGKVREFVAFLSPNKDEHWYSYEMAPVCFMASPNAIPDDTSIEAFELLMRITAAQTGTEITLHRYDRGEIHGGICCQKCDARCTNFHIIAGKDGHMYQFRVAVNRRMSEDKMLNWVTGWLDTMKFVDASPKEKNKTSPKVEQRERREQEIIQATEEAEKEREKERREKKREEYRELINSIERFFSKQGGKYFTLREIQEKAGLGEFSVQRLSVAAGVMIEDGFLVKKVDGNRNCYACKQKIIEEEKIAASSEAKAAKAKASAEAELRERRQRERRERDKQMRMILKKELARAAQYEEEEYRARHDYKSISKIKEFLGGQSKWYTSSELHDCLFGKELDYGDFLVILRIMVEDGFLVEKKEGRWRYYACKQNVIEEASSELTAAKENLSQYKKKFNSIPKLEKQLEEMKAENLVKIKAAAEAVEAAKAAYESCVEQKDKVQKELEGMGFFAFGEKKKAKAEIALLDNRAASLYTALTCAQSDKEKLEQSVEADEISAQNNIDKIRTDYSAAQERVAAAKEKAAEIEKMCKALPK